MPSRQRCPWPGSPPSPRRQQGLEGPLPSLARRPVGLRVRPARIPRAPRGPGPPTQVITCGLNSASSRSLHLCARPTCPAGAGAVVQTARATTAPRPDGGTAANFSSRPPLWTCRASPGTAPAATASPPPTTCSYHTGFISAYASGPSPNPRATARHLLQPRFVRFEAPAHQPLPHISHQRHRCSRANPVDAVAGRASRARLARPALPLASRPHATQSRSLESLDRLLVIKLDRISPDTPH